VLVTLGEGVGVSDYIIYLLRFKLSYLIRAGGGRSESVKKASLALTFLVYKSFQNPLKDLRRVEERSRFLPSLLFFFYLPFPLRMTATMRP
jgi:hypothetical protein